MTYLLIFLASCASTALLTGAVRRYALRAQVLDVPNARSLHAAPTPRGGGLGVVPVVLLVQLAASIWFGDAALPSGLTLLVAGGLAYSQLASGFMPRMDEGGFVLDYKARPGAALTDTDALLRQAEAIIRATPEVDSYSRRTGYQLGDQAFSYLPAGLRAQAALSPVYEEMDGWTETTQGARSWRDLPANAVKYVRRIEELIGAPVALLSTSPQREDTILMRDPFQD
jgi:hypothetical protein